MKTLSLAALLLFAVPMVHASALTGSQGFTTPLLAEAGRSNLLCLA